MKRRSFGIGLLFGIALVISTGFGFKRSYPPFSCGASRPAISVSSLSQIRAQKKLVDVLVIGSGPAGLSAAMYAARSRLHTLVIYGGQPGGQLTETTYVENWPGSKKQLGRDVIGGLEKQARSFGAEFLNDVVSSVDFSQWPYMIYTEDGRSVQALSVVIATGARALKLGVPGEYEYWGQGVATCAICDSPFYKNRDVVVVGGGDSAVEKTLQLATFARKVTVLVRKSSMRAAPAMQERLIQSPKVSILYNLEVQKIIGDGTNVTGIDVKNNKTGTISTMSTDGVFLAIGHIPNTELFKGQLEMTPHGYLHVQGRSQSTSVSGVFAAGEVEDDYYRQAGVASGDGIKAGLDVATFLADIGMNQYVADELEARGAYVDTFDDVPVSIEHLRSVDQFKSAVEKQKGLVVVDFYAENCPSCMQMIPVFESASRRFDDVTFLKVDAEEAKDIVRYLNVPKVPALLVFKDGALVDHINTTMNRYELLGLISDHINRDDSEIEA